MADVETRIAENLSAVDSTSDANGDSAAAHAERLGLADDVVCQQANIVQQ